MSREQWGHGFHAGVASVKGATRGKSRYLTADKAILCWNPDSDNVRVYEHPPKDGHYGHLEKFQCTTLADESFVSGLSFEQRKQLVFIEAMHLIIRDKCDPKAVHNALLEIHEYRDGCAADMPGI